ncbi:MAG: acyl-CoA dehydrogenase family protein [Bdellovibrionales bacterium]|nr:acyl-CoA dehydrogenase family protein [Bdellovibrionales bacterium]
MEYWNEEQTLLAKTVSDFATKELGPMAEVLDDTESFNLNAFKAMAPLGLLGVLAAEEYGGAALGCTEATLVMEKLSEQCASTTLSYLAHTILCVNNITENASDEQKRKYLPDLIAGKTIGGMGMTEPGAGSDMLGMQTKAVRKGTKFVLNGTKTYITNGPIGDVFVVYARTGNEKKEISTFIIEKDFPGFKTGKKLKKMGMRASPTGELVFDNCEVPEQNLVGKLNDSVSHMMRNLNIERITISGISLGLASATLKYAKQYVQERRQFDKPLSEFQATQQKIAEMATDLEAGRALTYSAAKAYDRGDRDMSLGAKAKLFTAQMATRAGLDGIQLLGGYGYTREYPVERYMRDAKLMEIGAGTNEIMRLIIARQELEL